MDIIMYVLVGIGAFVYNFKSEGAEDIMLPARILASVLISIFWPVQLMILVLTHLRGA